MGTVGGCGGGGRVHRGGGGRGGGRSRAGRDVTHRSHTVLFPNGYLEGPNLATHLRNTVKEEGKDVTKMSPAATLQDTLPDYEPRTLGTGPAESRAAREMPELFHFVFVVQIFKKNILVKLIP